MAQTKRDDLTAIDGLGTVASNVAMRAARDAGQGDDEMTTSEARAEARKLVARHPQGCSCGSPDCPQHEADLMGQVYYPERYVRAFVASQADKAANTASWPPLQLVRPRKPHSANAGYVAERKFGDSCIVIYRAQKAGIDVASDKYAVVCSKHGTICGVGSVPKARKLMKCPDFCESCMNG